MKNKVNCLWAVLGSLLLGATGAEASVILSTGASNPLTDSWDQYSFTSDANIPGNSPFPYNAQAYTDNSGPPGQTFTVSGSGAFTLDSFSFKGSGTGSGNTGVDGSTLWGIRISEISGTTLTPLLTLTGLGGVDLGGANGANWLTFQFSDSDLLSLNGGSTYAVEIYSGNFWWGIDASTSDVYSGGGALNTNSAARTFNSSVFQVQGYDRTFHAGLTAVPEPASSILFGLGFLSLYLLRKKNSGNRVQAGSRV